MIFKSLELSNVGVFRDTHLIDFNYPKKNKSITLVGALNGSGKTTLLDSLQLVLFGRRALENITKKTNYSEYIKNRIINDDTPLNETSYIKLIFTINNYGENAVYEIKRAWINSEKFTEQFDVKLNGVYSPENSDNWKNEIEKIIPPNIAKLFFYDGEKIENLADPKQSSIILKEGIYNLLGIDVIEKLMANIKRVISDKQKTFSPEVKQEIESIEDSIKIIDSEKQSLLTLRADATTKIDRKKLKKEKLDNDFEANDGQVWEQFDQIKENINKLKNDYSEIENELHKVAASSAPLILVKAQIKALIKQADVEEDIDMSLKFSKIINKHDDEILEEIKKIVKNDSKSISEIEKYLSINRKKYAPKKNLKPWLHASEYSKLIMANLTQREFSEKQKKAVKLLGEMKKIEAEKSAMIIKIESLDPNIKEKYIQNTEQINHDISSLQAKIDEIDIDINKQEKSLAEENQKLAKFSEKILENSDIQRFVNYSEKIRKSLEVYRNNKLNKHISNLEQTISDCYRALLRKKSLVKKITIDQKSFKIKVHKLNDDVTNTENLSAGERQLLSVAMLWALTLLAGRVIPIVIDTPLGRLDGKHREKLIEKYFPNASHQVVLLSTEEEIDKGLYKKLLPNISDAYTLKFSDNERSSSVHQGYFWG